MNLSEYILELAQITFKVLGNLMIITFRKLPTTNPNISIYIEYKFENSRFISLHHFPS